MAEYIEREVAKNAFPKAEADAFENCRYCTCLDSGQIGEILDNVPAADVVEVVRCRECIHRPSGTGVNHDVKFPDDACPCQCPDPWYSWVPPDDWYCASGERKDGGQDE